jgi:glycosyltransferase involved in cell wall biosynthesis
MVAQGLAASGIAMRICLVYDCLFPYTVGGAERWYRNLAERLAAEGHEVTYVTLRQWDRGDSADVKGVRVVAVGPRLALYTASGRRRIWPTLVFGLGVLAHLLVRGCRYDVIHTASFPYFSLLAAAAVRPLRGFRLIVDWHEVWTRQYWIEYLGGVGGRLGALVQQACVGVPHRAFCFSRLHARRLQESGYAGEPTVLEGEYDGSLEPREPEKPDRMVMFAGRHIPEKRVPALVPAMAAVRREHPDVRCVIFGDGPERERVEWLVREHGLQGAISVPGFVDASEVERSLRRSACLVLPSRREGYGMVVIEAAAAGTPSVVVSGDDNAATELVEEGVNGFIADSASPGDLAGAINRVLEGDMPLRRTTAKWFGHNARRLSLESSLKRVTEAYAGQADVMR